jgi:hypothetical protein
MPTMLKRDTPPLAAEISELQEFLNSATPQAIIKLEHKLSDARVKRAEDAARYQQALTQWRAEHRNDVGPSTEIRAMAEGLKKQDDGVNQMRAELKRQRASWAPVYFRAIKPLLATATPALRNALAIIEAASVLHSHADDFTRNSSLADWSAPKSGRLDAIAEKLSRFIGTDK